MYNTRLIKNSFNTTNLRFVIMKPVSDEFGTYVGTQRYLYHREELYNE